MDLEILDESYTEIRKECWLLRDRTIVTPRQQRNVIRKLFSPLFWSVCLVFVKDLSTTLASAVRADEAHPHWCELSFKRYQSPELCDQPFRTFKRHKLYGDVFEIESRLREIRMMIPEIRAVIADSEPQMRDQLRFLLAEESGSRSLPSVVTLCKPLRR